MFQYTKMWRPNCWEIYISKLLWQSIEEKEIDLFNLCFYSALFPLLSPDIFSIMKSFSRYFPFCQLDWSLALNLLNTAVVICCSSSPDMIDLLSCQSSRTKISFHLLQVKAEYKFHISYYHLKGKNLPSSNVMSL